MHNHSPDPAARKLDIEQRVLSILRETVGGDPAAINRDTKLFEIGDSLDRVENIMQLEEEFEIAIDDAAAERLQTVADLIDLITTQSLASARSPTPKAEA
jgi:acyl carrier protein